MSSPYPTNRWRGIVAIAIGTLGVGLLATEPAIIVLAAVCIGFAVYPYVRRGSPEPEVTLDRSVEPADPAPDEPVLVELTVRNRGSYNIPDLRVVDGVPPLATVIEGSPRLATALRPGEAATIRYGVAVPAGKHRFAPTTLIARDPAGAVERTQAIESPAVIDCDEEEIAAPLSTVVTYRPGSISTDRGGVGVEFYGTREANTGEAIDRIDWRQFARTGQLVAVEFRPERAANVVVCVDVVDSQRRGESGAGSPDLAMRCRTVADRIATALGTGNHAVGLAVVGDGDIWIPPGIGRSHVDRVREALELEPAFCPTMTAFTDGESHTGTAPIATVDRATGADARNAQTANGDLGARLGPHDQAILVSPMLDDAAFETALGTSSPSERVTVISPKPGVTDDLGARLARLERATRIRALRAEEIRVLEWGAEESLAVAARGWMEGVT